MYKHQGCLSPSQWCSHAPWCSGYVVGSMKQWWCPSLAELQQECRSVSLTISLLLLNPTFTIMFALICRWNLNWISPPKPTCPESSKTEFFSEKPGLSGHFHYRSSKSDYSFPYSCPSFDLFRPAMLLAEMVLNYVIWHISVGSSAAPNGWPKSEH